MGTRHGEPKRDSNGPGTQPALPARATPIRMGKDTMTIRNRLTRSSGPVTRLSASFAGLVALAAATLGFASAAGVAGTAPLPRLAKPRPGTPPGRGSSAYLGRLPGDPHGGLASASVTFTVPKISCTTADKNKGCGRVERRLHGSFRPTPWSPAICLSTGPVYEWQFSTLAGTFNEPGAAAGDVVVASLFQSGTSTLAEIHDLTENVSLGFRTTPSTKATPSSTSGH